MKLRNFNLRQSSHERLDTEGQPARTPHTLRKAGVGALLALSFLTACSQEVDGKPQPSTAPSVSVEIPSPTPTPEQIPASPAEAVGERLMAQTCTIESMLDTSTSPNGSAEGLGDRVALELTVRIASQDPSSKLESTDHWFVGGVTHTGEPIAPEDFDENSKRVVPGSFSDLDGYPTTSKKQPNGDILAQTWLFPAKNQVGQIDPILVLRAAAEEDGKPTLVETVAPCGPGVIAKSPLFDNGETWTVARVHPSGSPGSSQSPTRESDITQGFVN